jgi:integrase
MQAHPTFRLTNDIKYHHTPLTLNFMKTIKSFEYPFIHATPFGKVKIYRNSEGARTRYIVAWIDPDQGRQRKAYESEAQAHQRAKEIVEDLKRGVTFRNKISAASAVKLAEYESLLKERGATLGDAVKHYLEFLDRKAAQKILSCDAVTKYLDSMEDKASRHYETAKHVLIKFGRFFNGSLCSITVTELDSYLKGLSKSGRTRNNHLGYLKTFFKWAQEWGGYMPEGSMPINKIKLYEEETIKIEVFTPEEIHTLLSAADQNLRPYLAIGAFAGVRCAEIERLSWEDLDFETKTIKLSASVTKTKRRRLVTMPDNLIEWLKLHPQPLSGPIVPKPNRLTAERAQLCKTTGVTWKDNVLRKSFISYRMAQSDSDAIQVSKQCGNSPAMVEEHYKELVSPKAADRWFSLYPSSTK